MHDIDMNRRDDVLLTHAGVVKQMEHMTLIIFGMDI